MADAKEIELHFGMGAAPAIANFTLNQAADAAEFVFQVPPGAASYTITRLGFRQGTATGTAPAYRVSIQGVNASGNPDGTIKNAGNAFFDYTPTAGNNNTWQWVTLGATYAASPGELLAMVITYAGAGTIDGSNNGAFAVTAGGDFTPGVPYAIQNDNGSRTRQLSSTLFGWGTASKAYGKPVSAVVASNVGNTNERALKFNIPPTWWSTYKVMGCLFQGTMTAAGSLTVTLYDTDGTSILQDISWDTDQDQQTAAARFRRILFNEASLATLNAGSAYRLAIKQDSGNLVVNAITCASADDLEAWPGGSIATYSTQAGGGGWSDDAASRPLIGLILADITAPAAGGGGLIHPGFNFQLAG
jgi:hypothetical protein